MALPALGCGLSVFTMAISILPKNTWVGPAPGVAPRCLMYQSRAWAGSLTRMWTLSIARFGTAGSAAITDAAASKNEAHRVATFLMVSPADLSWGRHATAARNIRIGP